MDLAAADRKSGHYLQQRARHGWAVFENAVDFRQPFRVGHGNGRGERHGRRLRASDRREIHADDLATDAQLRPAILQILQCFGGSGLHAGRRSGVGDA